MAPFIYTAAHVIYANFVWFKRSNGSVVGFVVPSHLVYIVATCIDVSSGVISCAGSILPFGFGRQAEGETRELIEFGNHPLAIVPRHIIDRRLRVRLVLTWVVIHDGLPQCLRHLGLGDEVVLGQCDFVAWELVCLCVRVIVCGTHHERTCADTHHIEANAIDGEGDRWIW